MNLPARIFFIELNNHWIIHYHKGHCQYTSINKLQKSTGFSGLLRPYAPSSRTRSCSFISDMLEIIMS